MTLQIMLDDTSVVKKAQKVNSSDKRKDNYFIKSSSEERRLFKDKINRLSLIDKKIHNIMLEIPELRMTVYCKEGSDLKSIKEIYLKLSREPIKEENV